MRKLNPIIYNKLLAQAEEAKEQGLTKLAADIFEAIGPYAADEVESYSYTQLKDDIHRDMWKMASKLMVFHDVNSADAEKVDQAIVHWASKAISDLEMALGVDNVLKGPLEPPVPGEDK